MIRAFKSWLLTPQKHDGLRESAVLELKAGWLRLPLAPLMSSMLVVLCGWGPALAWLGAILAFEAASIFITRRTVAEAGRWRAIYRLNSVVIATLWAVFPTLVWLSGGEAARIAGLAGFFTIALYAVLVCHHDSRQLAVLLLPTMTSISVLMALRVGESGAQAVLFIVPAVSFIAVIGVTGWLCHFNFNRLADAQAEVLAEKAMLEARVMERTRELEAALVGAEAANTEKSQFLSKMSHELRTPLNAIINYSEMLEEDLGESGSEETRADLARIRKAGGALLALIENLFETARIASGDLRAAYAWCDAGALMREAGEMMRAAAAQQGNDLEIAIGEGIERVWTDPARLRQGVLHLLSNACRFTQGGAIRLSCSRDGRNLVVRVSDTGAGVSEAQLKRLFEPFQQGDNSWTRAHDGAGLGLSITRRLAELLGGEVSAESVVGVGSTFTLRVPLSEPALAA